MCNVSNIELHISLQQIEQSATLTVVIDNSPVSTNHTISCANMQTMTSLALHYQREMESGSDRLDASQIRSIGDSLFTMWLSPFWSEIAARADSHRRFTVLSESAEVLNLPWELLCLPGIGFLGLDPRFSIRRQPTLCQLPDIGRRLPARPLRVLFTACAPQDQDSLDYEREESVMIRAIAETGGSIELHSCDMGSFDELGERVNQFRPQVVHMSGHGVVSEDSCGYFAFEDNRGHTDLRSSEDIARTLFSGSSVQCVFISGCQTGLAPWQDATKGVCQGLVEHGIPLAIGWAASVPDVIATKFAASFYRTVACGQSIDRALTLARLAILDLCEEQGVPYWTLPVVYSSTTQNLVVDPDPERNLEQSYRPMVIQHPLPGMTEGYAHHFVGRRKEIQEVLPLLQSGEVQTLLITGMGGIGKSTLATKLVRRLESAGFIPVPIPSAFSNPLNASRLLQHFSDTFLFHGFQDAYDIVNNSSLHVADRLHYIVNFLNRSKFLVVLDNFEINLDTDTKAISDRNVADFYRYLLDHLSGQSRAIITSRYTPSDTNPLPAVVKLKALGDFPEAAFLKFLFLNPQIEERYYNEDISYSDLLQLHSLIGGTPRLLEQVEEILITISSSELKQCLENMSSYMTDNQPRVGQIRADFLAAIFTERLYANLDTSAQKALCAAAAYSMAVPISGIAAAARIREDDAVKYASEWQDNALAYSNSASSSTLWAVYGAIRYWLQSPERTTREDYLLAHKAAGEYLTSVVLNKQEHLLNLSRWDVLLEAQDHFLRAEEYELAGRVTSTMSNEMMYSGFYDDVISINQRMLGFNSDADSLLWIGRAQLYQGEYIESDKTLTAALNNKQHTDDLELHAQALAALGTVKMRLGDYETARQKFAEALEIATKHSLVQLEVGIRHQLASANLNQCRFDKARSGFTECVELARYLERLDLVNGALHQIATIDMQQGKHDEARRAYQECLRIEQALGHRYGEAAVLHSLGVVDTLEEKYDSALKHLQSSLSIKRDIGDLLGEAHSLHNLGVVELKVGNKEIAQSIFEACIEIKTNIGDVQGLSATMLNLAHIKASDKDYTTARNLLIKSLMIDHDLGNVEGEAAVWENLGDLAICMEKQLNGLILMGISYVLLNRIGHGSTGRVRDRLNRMTGGNENTRQVILEAENIYEGDSGSRLLDCTFGAVSE